jgi:hypothetical protein
MRVSVESDTISSLGRAAHDIGAAALLGGSLFGRQAMHPALSRVSSERERGSVTNAAWRRYGAVNGISLAAILAGWAGARGGEARPRMLSERERTLARAKDVAVGAVAVTGIASAIEGMRFARSAPGGAVPLEDGNTPAPDTPPGAANLKRTLNWLGSASTVSQAALIGINAALAQSNFRRPPMRRLLKRRY